MTPGESPAPAPAPPAPATPQAGWVQPPEGGRSRSCCLILVVIGAAAGLLAIVAIVGLVFLGSQVSTILQTQSQALLAGTVEFESGTATGCLVQRPATSFQASDSIHVAAHFEREVQVGETVTVVVTYPDGTPESTETSYEEAGDCVSDTIPPGLETGSWRIEFHSGTELLATGAFEITP
jgi:hypothetical protein